MLHIALRLVAAVLGLAFVARAEAESVKIGTLHTTGSGPVYIAQEKGYFAAEGIAAELVFFESAQPISVATASGDIDFGYTGLTGGYYGLASQGQLRIVAGGAREGPGFHYQPILVSKHAYEAGLRTFKDFPGHSFGVSQIGSPPHYALGLLAEKYGFDIKSMRLIPLQSIPNLVSAISSGQADATMMPGNTAVPLLQRGDAKLLGYVGDETPYQLVGMFVATKYADARGATIERVLRALRKGARDYHDAFTGADGMRANGPTAPAMAAIMAKYANQSAEELSKSLPFSDADARLDVKDVLRQFAWYKAQGLVKGTATAESLIDMRYVVALPQS